MVVSMGSICASGGYYLAMAVGDQKTQEDVIFAEPTTWTGSIGVVIPHYDVSELLDQLEGEGRLGRQPQVQADGQPHPRPLAGRAGRGAEAAARRWSTRASIASRRSSKRAGRSSKANEAELKKATTGQIFTAEQAQELGLIDKIGFMEAAIERAAELAGKETDNVRCVEYDKPPSPLTALLGADSQLLPQRNSLDLAGVLDLTAPRAYYLCTWLPAILSNTR